MRSHASIYDRRQVLSSLKASAEERRAKSPTVYSIKTQKSVLNDAELDENGDMPFPKDETKGVFIVLCIFIMLFNDENGDMPYPKDETKGVFIVLCIFIMLFTGKPLTKGHLFFVYLSCCLLVNH